MNIEKEKAMAQFSHETDELSKMVEQSSEFKRIAEAAARLRNMSSGRRFEALAVLSHAAGHGSFLQAFPDILNPDDELILPRSLCRLLYELDFNICDDGYLRICKIEVLDDIALKFSREEFAKYNRTQKGYFLSSNEDMTDAELTSRWIDCNGFFNPKLVSFKKEDFGTLEKFAEFLEILADDRSWNVDGMLNMPLFEEKIDRLLFSK